MIHLVLHLGRAAATGPAMRSTAAALVAIMTRLIAGSLNMPEALLRDTGDFVVAYVSAVEQRAGLVCPRRVMRELRQHKAAHKCGPSGPTSPLATLNHLCPHPKGDLP